MTDINLSIEDYTPPAKAPHPLRDAAQGLIDAGPGKVASARFETDEEARRFVRRFAKAAQELDKSARLVDIVEVPASGKDPAAFVARFRITEKFTRTKGDDTAAE